MPALQHALEQEGRVAGGTAAGIVGCRRRAPPCRRSLVAMSSASSMPGSGSPSCVAHRDQLGGETLRQRAPAPRPDRPPRRYRPASCCPCPACRPTGTVRRARSRRCRPCPPAPDAIDKAARRLARGVEHARSCRQSTTAATQPQTLLGHVPRRGRPVRRRAPECRCADIPSSDQKVGVVDHRWREVAVRIELPPITTSGPTIARTRASRSPSQSS